jgi:hypothetical protein
LHPRRLRPLLGALAIVLSALLAAPASALAAATLFTVDLASNLTGGGIPGASVAASTYDATYGQVATGGVYASVYDNGNGTYTVSDLVGLSQSDVWTVSAVYGGTTSTTAQNVYADESMPPTVTLYWPAVRETVSASPSSVPADGHSQATVTAAVYDSNGNPLQGVPVAFRTTLGALTSVTVSTSVYGTASDTLTSTTAGTAAVTAAVSGITSNNTATVDFTATGGGAYVPPGTGSSAGSSSGASSGIGGAAAGTAAPGPSDLQNAIAAGNGKATIVVTPANGLATLQLSTTDLATLASTGGVLQVEAGTVTVDLPAADVTPAALASNPALSGVSLTNATVSLQIQAAPAPSSISAPPGGPAGSASAVSSAYTFTLQVSAGGTTVSLEDFVQPILVSMQYTGGSAVDPELVAVYRLDASGNATFAGGVANASSGTVTAALTHFSQYVALEFTAAFTDVPAGHWAAHDVAVAAAHQITLGTSATTFAPDQTLTRATFVTMLARALGLPTPSSTTTAFTDVAPSAWYAGTVAAAVQAGLVDGTSATTFSPDLPLTREQMAVLLARAATYQGKNNPLSSAAAQSALSPFGDAGALDGWAYAATAYAVSAGLVRGEQATTLDPLGTATRAEAAAVLVRYLFGAAGN